MHLGLCALWFLVYPVLRRLEIAYPALGRTDKPIAGIGLCWQKCASGRIFALPLFIPEYNLGVCQLFP
jgi:hypothetical protein